MATTLTLVETRTEPSPRVSNLTDALDAEDRAEDTGWLDPLDRLTCRVHRRWIHECSHSDLHVIEITGHRWCRPCRRAMEIAVDEVSRTVTLHCPRCHRGATTRADRQLVAACEASLRGQFKTLLTVRQTGASEPVLNWPLPAARAPRMTAAIAA